MPDVNAVNPTVDEVRAELGLVLSTPAFARSTRAARLLEYLCDKALTGCAEEIKEYNIAVDVLGRPTSFDPANDASARVEVHRLRKKLKDYYDGEGRENPTRIVIPTGSYVPTFSRPESADHPVDTPVAIDPEVIHVAPAALPAARPSTRRPKWLVPSAALAVLAVVAGTIWYARTGSAKTEPSRGRERRAAAVPIPAGEPIRIACGRTAAFTDSTGRQWDADRLFNGGRSVAPAVRVKATRTPDVFAGAREGAFSYDIPLKSGVYEMHLYFAETRFGVGDDGGGESSRVFHVLANSKPILSDFDITSDAGAPATADARTFKDVAPAEDGMLHLRFIPSQGDAVISAIELVPARKGLMNPIRMLAQDATYTDPQGRKWTPDDFVNGGRIGVHLGQRPSLPPLYSTERYGRFTYDIPVADNGSYDLAIHMAETYWGIQGAGGPGSRLFDIFCNGETLARNVDISQRVGANKPLVLRYEGLKPNAQGKLRISFIPVKNYATVCALEVEDASE